MPRVLYLYGGWPGHSPYAVADWAKGIFRELGLDQVDESNDIFTLDRDLTGYDLIVIGWNNAVTTETLTTSQEDRLLTAVASGTGLAGWHGGTQPLAGPNRPDAPARFEAADDRGPCAQPAHCAGPYRVTEGTRTCAS